TGASRSRTSRSAAPSASPRSRSGRRSAGTPDVLPPGEDASRVSPAIPPIRAIDGALPGQRSLSAVSVAVYSGPFGQREATRLLWRAGFGPRPGDASKYAALGLNGSVTSL